MLYMMHMESGGAEQDPVQRKQNLENCFNNLMQKDGVDVKYQQKEENDGLLSNFGKLDETKE